jgi:hypothetical protein
VAAAAPRSASISAACLTARTPPVTRSSATSRSSGRAAAIPSSSLAGDALTERDAGPARRELRHEQRQRVLVLLPRHGSQPGRHAARLEGGQHHHRVALDRQHQQREALREVHVQAGQVDEVARGRDDGGGDAGVGETAAQAGLAFEVGGVHRTSLTRRGPAATGRVRAGGTLPAMSVTDTTPSPLVVTCATGALLRLLPRHRGGRHRRARRTTAT